MFIFHIYNSFETEGHCRDQGDFYLLNTIISFNNGKINMKKTSYNYYHITMKNLSVPIWDAEILPHSICKEQKMSLVHKWLPILLNAFDSILLYYRTVKRLQIPIHQIKVRNGKLVCYFSTKTYVVGTEMGLLNETVLLKTKNTLFNLLIR